MVNRRTIDLEVLTLRQYMVLVSKPPMYVPQDLVTATGLPQPRASEVLRGTRIYPAGIEKVKRALGIPATPAGDELFEKLLANSAREAAR